MKTYNSFQKIIVIVLLAALLISLIIPILTAAVYGEEVDPAGSEQTELASDNRKYNSFDMLNKLKEIAPVYMSLGNHEGGAVKKVRDFCRDNGITLLEDAHTEFEGIRIGGLTSGLIVNDEPVTEHHLEMTPPPNLEWLASFAELEGYKLLLNHHPEYYPVYIKPLNIDLTLSGHAHGGQVRIFGKGLIAPGQGFFPKYTSGMHDGRLIVSRGLANNAPPIPRLFNRTELIFIEFSN